MHSNYYQAFKEFFQQQEKVQISQNLIEYGNDNTKKFTSNAQIGDMGVHRIVKFEVLDKGCLIYAEGEKYPIRGHVADSKVAEVAKFKRIIPLLFRFLLGKGEFNNNVFQKIIVIIGITQYWKFLLAWIHWAIKDVYHSNPDRYSQPVRELYRVIKNEKVRDIVCAFLEYDTAYRYIFQDTIVHLNKENFQKNPTKEIKRLFTVVRQRDRGLMEKLLYVEKAFIVLKFNKRLMAELKQFVADLDLHEVSSSPEDIYWQNQDPIYDYRGISNDKRKELYLKEKYG